MKKTLTLQHDKLRPMDWPRGSVLVVDTERKPREYDIVEFQADGIRDVGIYRPAPCGRCASFVGERVYDPREWQILGVALYSLAE